MRTSPAAAVNSQYLVPFDGSFSISDTRTDPPRDAPDKAACKDQLAHLVRELDAQQHLLYAQGHHSVLVIFQAMDAAGKDSTIRAVLTGVDPAGCEVHGFRQPTPLELDHDFLWRTSKRLPQRGHIGVFNRSYYEEVLAVRVHPGYLKAQRVALPKRKHEIWEQRFESIRDHEKHLSRNGTLILKFWLHVSKGEQRRRFLSRLTEPERNWKFRYGDVRDRAAWKKYMHAYEAALRETSRPWAPWYAIPADDKHYMRTCVADIIVRTLHELNLHYPKLGRKERTRFRQMRKALERE